MDLKTDDLERIFKRRDKAREELMNKERKEKRRANTKSKIKHIGLPVLIAAILLGGGRFELKRRHNHTIQKKESSINKAIEEYTLPYFHQEKEEYTFGTNFEEYLMVDLTDKKISLLNKIPTLNTWKNLVDNEREDKPITKTIDANVSGSMIQKISNFVKEVIYIDNPNLSKEAHKVSYHYDDIEDSCYIYADKKYIVEDQKLKSFFKNLSYLENRNHSLHAQYQYYDELIDGVLTLTAYDIKLEEGILTKNKVVPTLPENYKVLEKYSNNSNRVFKAL